MMPGRALHRLAAHICSERSLDRIVEPAIADLQREYTGAGRASRRAWVLLAGYAAIVTVMAMCAVSVSGPSDDERRALSRTFVWCVVLVIVTTALLMLPPLYGFDQAIRGWYAAMMLLPQAVPLAIPIGIAFGIAFGSSARITATTAKMMLLCALAASALSFGILAWAMPAGNQAFRELSFRALQSRGYDGPYTAPPKAYNEMTLSELRREIAEFSAAGETGLARQHRHRLHLRFSLAAATLTLASFLLAAPFNHRALRGLLAFLMCFVYWALIYTGEALSVYRTAIPAFAGAWLPNIVLVAAALLIASSRSSRLRGPWNTAP